MQHQLDDQLDALVAAAVPVTDEHLRATGSGLAGAVADLREEVLVTPRLMAPPARRSDGAAGGRRLVVAAALAVFVAAFVVVGGRGGDEDAAWAAEEVAFAEASPLLLLDADGWEVTRADQQPGLGGEMTFALDDEKLELSWRTDGANSALDRYLDLVEEVSTLGTSVSVLRDAGSEVHVATWSSAGADLELWGSMDADHFVQLLRALRVVDANTWLSALPASTVKAIDRTRVVAEMLADVDVPPGFGPAELLTADAQIRDRYQLGAQVSSAVACAWLERWYAAEAAGDRAAMDAAAAAMAGSHGWAVLAEMDPNGAYPETLWEVADSMVAGNPSTGGGGGPGSGDPRSALGCESS